MYAPPLNLDALKDEELGTGIAPVLALNPPLALIPAPPYEARAAGALNG